MVEQQAKNDAKFAELEAKNEALTRAFERRSEQRAKMPPPPKPPRTKEEVAEHRRQQAQLRADNVVTTEDTIPVPPEQKKCPLCAGTNFRSVGIGKPSVTWSFVPAHFRKHVHMRETVACRCGGHVVTAPAPERWSEKTRYDASFVAHVIVSKCLMSTPLYRLEADFKRLGIPILRTTLNDLFRRGAQKLAPLREPLITAIRADEIVHADETPFKLTTQKSKAFIWAFVGRSLTGLRVRALARGRGRRRRARGLEGHHRLRRLPRLRRHHGARRSHALRVPRALSGVDRYPGPLHRSAFCACQRGNRAPDNNDLGDDSEERNASRSGVGRHRAAGLRVRPARRQNALSTSRLSFMFVARYRPVVATLACPR